jgi:SWI/SNF-related matrix-associated actin-dependent regulator of chromatin subfamily A3
MNRIHIIQTNDGKENSVLNTRTSRALQELDRQSLVRYNVYVGASEWTSKIRSFTTRGRSTCLDIEMYFFGSLDNSAKVGRILSDTGHFLQPPDFLDSSIPYKNPHEIIFPSVSDPGSPMRISDAEFNLLDDLSGEMVTTVLGNLDHTGDLVSSNIDSNIITTELKL